MRMQCIDIKCAQWRDAIGLKHHISKTNVVREDSIAGENNDMNASRDWNEIAGEVVSLERLLSTIYNQNMDMM